MGRASRNARRKLLELTERFNDTMEIPQATVPGNARIELTGNKEVLVDGCQNILQYDDSVIRLSTGRLVVSFTGSALCVDTMQQNQIRITGTILSVDFS